MSKFHRLLAGVCCVMFLAVCFVQIGFPLDTKAAPEKSLKVLAIGNSFSEDALRHMYQIARSAGASEIVLGNLYIGSCNLNTHWTNAKNNVAGYEYQKNSNGSWSTTKGQTMESGLKDENWDFIVLQQVSGLSGVESTYNSDLTNLIAYVNSKKTNPEAKLAWHMTWAYQSDSNHWDFWRYEGNQMTMYNAIVSTVQNKVVTNQDIDIIIPSGTAIQNLRTSTIGDTLTRDGYHLSYYLGRYVAGLTWLKALTGWTIDDISYFPTSPEISSGHLPLIKEAVNKAVATPFAVSEITGSTDASSSSDGDMSSTDSNSQVTSSASLPSSEDQSAPVSSDSSLDIQSSEGDSIESSLESQGSTDLSGLTSDVSDSSFMDGNSWGDSHLSNSSTGDSSWPTAFMILGVTMFFGLAVFFGYRYFHRV